MVMMASQHVPDKIILQQLASAINIAVPMARLIDGTRKVMRVGKTAPRMPAFPACYNSKRWGQRPPIRTGAA
jgi:hypothetical protein